MTAKYAGSDATERSSQMAVLGRLLPVTNESPLLLDILHLDSQLLAHCDHSRFPKTAVRYIKFNT